jgi:hypothetical protein
LEKKVTAGMELDSSNEEEWETIFEFAPTSKRANSLFGAQDFYFTIREHAFQTSTISPTCVIITYIDPESKIKTIFNIQLSPHRYTKETAFPNMAMVSWTYFPEYERVGTDVRVVNYENATSTTPSKYGNPPTIDRIFTISADDASYTLEFY